MSPERGALHKALALYESQTAGVRLHTRIRAWTAPLEPVIAAIPETARLLDVGCGHGLISNAVAVRNESARVLGVDVSETKIASARATVGSRPNVEFRKAALESLEETDFDAVSLVDVLYLVPAASWTAFLGRCFEKLKPGGVFVLKEIGTSPRWKFERLRLQEFVSTKVIRITSGDQMHFESGDALRGRLVSMGLVDVALTRLDRGYMSPHLMVTGRKPS